MNRAIKKYCCGECGNSYGYPEAAEECCPHRVYENFECPVCAELYPIEKNAMECCAESEEFKYKISSVELEAAGQQRLPL